MEWSDRFLRHVTSHFSDSCTRVDVLFDRYVKSSIKEPETSARRRRAQELGAMWIAEIRELETGKGASL